MLKCTWAVILSFAFLVCTLGFSNPQQSGDEALDQLVEAERAFARASVENGLRESFIAFFADDGINFQPHPTKTKEAMLSRPPTKRPLEFTLNWEPIYADVSYAGDLGYTTGPYTLKDNSPQSNQTNYGFYFSIWKRQPDGSWKVEVDCGISTPNPPAPGLLKFHPATSERYVSKAPINLNAERQSLAAVEKRFSATANSEKLSAAYTDVLANDARLHRNDLIPLTDAKAIGAFLNKQTVSMSWSPLRTDIAKSADLGYTYGSYQSKDLSTGKVVESGYYVHVWKKARSGEWKLVLDTTNPLPDQKK